MRNLARIVFVLALSASCRSHCPPPVVSHVTVQQHDCLAKAPPVAVAFAVYRGTSCPAPFASCLLKADSQALSTMLVELADYARDAWTRCGKINPAAPRPAPTTTLP